MSDTSSCAALTMVWKSYKLLNKWIAHYGKEFGREKLYIISHGSDVEHDKIARGCNIIHIPRVLSERFDVDRFKAMSHYASMLLRYHSAVIVGDVDELLCVDPKTGLGLSDMISQLEGGNVYAPLGCHILAERNDLRIDWDQPILEQTRLVFPDGRYTKPSILKDDAEIGAGGHSLCNQDFMIAENIVMLHLKYLPDEDLRMYDSEVTVDLLAGWTDGEDAKGHQIGTHWLHGSSRVKLRLERMLEAQHVSDEVGLNRSLRQIKAKYVVQNGMSYIRRIRPMKFNLPRRFSLEL